MGVGTFHTYPPTEPDTPLNDADHVGSFFCYQPPGGVLMSTDWTNLAKILERLGTKIAAAKGGGRDLPGRQ